MFRDFQYVGLGTSEKCIVAKTILLQLVFWNAHLGARLRGLLAKISDLMFTAIWKIMEIIPYNSSFQNAQGSSGSFFLLLLFSVSTYNAGIARKWARSFG